MSLPNEISTTLLLSHPARIDIDRLRLTLEARMAPNSPGFVERTWRHEPLLSAHNVHLRLRVRDLPVPGQRLKGSLDSGLAEMLRETLSSTVARHRAALAISVGFGSEPAENADAETEPPTQEAFDQLLILGHVAANRLAQDCHPIALHWGQSDLILSAQRFAAMTDMLFPLPLFLHPKPTLLTYDDVEWLSLDVAGAEHLIGRTLRTEAAPVGYGWMMQRVYAFVAHMRASGQDVADGMAFATAQGERFAVLHDEDGGLRLVLTELDGRRVDRPVGPPFSDAA